jgi:hypothetical protein
VYSGTLPSVSSVLHILKMELFRQVSGVSEETAASIIRIEVLYIEGGGNLVYRYRRFEGT